MTKESNEEHLKKQRRKRFEPSEPEHNVMTQIKRKILLQVAECWFLTTPQVASMMGISEQATRNHLRDLLDMQYLEGRGVDRSTLASPDEANDHHLLGGRAPTVHVPTPVGFTWLVHHKYMRRADVREAPNIGPKNKLFLPHEVQARELQIWLTQVHKAHPDHDGVQWAKYGTDTWINLGKDHYPMEVRPDATLVYHFENAGMAVFLEVDRDTETKRKTWEDKFREYEALFQTTLIHEITGFKTARIIVTAPDAPRRDWIARILNDMYQDTTMPPNRFWLVTESDLKIPKQAPKSTEYQKYVADLSTRIWRVPDITSGKQPFLLS